MATIKHHFSLAMTGILLAVANAAAQTPTHIDPGADGESVHITDDVVYIVIVVAFLVLLAAYFVLLRKRMQNRRGKDKNKR